ncbi:hypothetical protein [Mesorhizobium sp.]|uniref:hypothetical protein n=1 Tax=Mesorhizobium sp. TaxID=1871066 RepID=UPI000FE88FEB|nr:hypothetical protein [Mesorhizobium sp.]RWP06510.1 MAG: hypothetical protein EOQ99_12185 [Mesorhizobium sp.]
MIVEKPATQIKVAQGPNNANRTISAALGAAMEMRVCTIQTLLVIAALLISQIASAAEGVPFPDLDTECYCTALVSKMLVKTEQQIERDKCLLEERALRARLEPFWYLVKRAESDRLKKDYLTEGRFQTYLNVSSFVASALGRACLDGRVFCSPDEPPATTALSVFRSDYYCYLGSSDAKSDKFRNCSAAEKKRKEQLAKYWTKIPGVKKDRCIGWAFRRDSRPSKYYRTALPRTSGPNASSKLANVVPVREPTDAIIPAPSNAMLVLFAPK